MEPDEVALSDVHIYGPNICTTVNTSQQYRVVKTRFYYSHESLTTTQSQGLCSSYPEESCVPEEQYDTGKDAPDVDPESPQLDIDGDLDVCRKPTPNLDVLTIEHTMATTLIDVGLQVWQGCLYLCDYILHHPSLFSQSVVMELGGGTGMASVIMATVARVVICTDIGDEVLSVCARNLLSHRHLYHQDTVAIARELNWKEGQLKTDTNSPFNWTPLDIDLYNKVDIIVAADVIYSDLLTDAFMEIIYKFLKKRPGGKVFVVLEKRMNFTITNLEVACPAYDNYRVCLEELQARSGMDQVYFTVKQTTVVPQYFMYDRNKYLELWEISSSLGG